MRRPTSYPRMALALALLLAALVQPAAAAEAPRAPVTGILGAMASEVALLQGRLQNKETQTFLGISFTTGTLAGRRVVLARSGVGKVNAAEAAALMLDHFQPTEVIFTGVAGAVSPKLAPGDIVLGVRTTQHDFGNYTTKGFEPQETADPVTGARNPRYFPAPERLLRLAETAARDVQWETLPTSEGKRTPKVVRGNIATGDMFVASPAKCAELRQMFGADAVEMEGAAVAQVCRQQDVPCLVIRCMSDKADAAAATDFEQFFRVAANNSARLVEKMMGLLATEKP